MEPVIEDHSLASGSLLALKNEIIHFSLTTECSSRRYGLEGIYCLLVKRSNYSPSQSSQEVSMGMKHRHLHHRDHRHGPQIKTAIKYRQNGNLIYDLTTSPICQPELGLADKRSTNKEDGR